MLSIYEIGAIIFVALLVFGPRKLPEIGKALGRSVKEFKEGREEGDRNTVDVTPEPPVPAKKDEKNEK